MPRVAYTVDATFPSADARDEYVAWLLGGHVGAVLGGGALSAQVVRIEDPPEPVRVEVRYLFASRESFERYVRETAPRLRAEGLARFGAGSGVSFRRTVGEVLA